MYTTEKHFTGDNLEQELFFVLKHYDFWNRQNRFLYFWTKCQMEKLSNLPNISKVLESKLNEAEIFMPEQLKALGAENAW